MHKYLRAIGFSKIQKRIEVLALIDEVAKVCLSGNGVEGYAHSKDAAVDAAERNFCELSLDFLQGAGICIRGELDEDGNFLYEYYFPYLKGTSISSAADVSLERHAEKESFLGISDDIRAGVTLIFFMQNIVPYKKYHALGLLPVDGSALILSALSIEGTVMMPISKNERDKRRKKAVALERNQLIEQARMGDESALESLTLEDMDTYTILAKKLQKMDVFSLVDTYFMPFGVECDQFSILGEIVDFHMDKNRITGEEVIFMTIECNEILFDVCINKEDLYGEAAVGRRFKGIIWLQGCITYP